VQRLAYVRDPNDTMVVAGALQANARYLVTYDRKHLLEDDTFTAQSGVYVVTPSTIVRDVLHRSPADMDE
jgi:predicted nucleic acid-binding protein